MKLNLHILLLALLFPSFLYAQMCEGNVFETETGSPVIYAHVFLDGSHIGTITDSTGHFSFNTQGNTSLPLVISAIGYEPVILHKNYISDDSIIYLEKKDYELGEVNISPDNKSREKYLRMFRREFLGTTKNGLKCEILNEDNIFSYYNEKTKILHVNALKPLEIINQNLGYKVIYHLISFKKSREGVKYTGYGFFIELEQKDEKAKKKTEENRLSAFAYSRLNFIRCLYNEPLRYTVFKLADMQGELVPTDEILFETDSGEKEICYNKVLTVYFDWKGIEPYFAYSPEERKWIWSSTVINAPTDGKYSYFILNDECVKIEKNGYYNPESISWFGDLASHRVGDMLPYNYYVTTREEQAVKKD